MNAEPPGTERKRGADAQTPFSSVSERHPHPVLTTTQQRKRLVLPYTLQCLRCQTYIQRGRKLTVRRESSTAVHAPSEHRNWRYLLCCPRCRARFALRPRKDAHLYSLESSDSTEPLLVRNADLIAPQAHENPSSVPDELDAAITGFMQEMQNPRNVRTEHETLPYKLTDTSAKSSVVKRARRASRSLPGPSLAQFLTSAESIFDEEPLWNNSSSVDNSTSNFNV
ncbi:hypothetical protein CYME_CMN267C [Cyanidioschyzon merolae strain 10D]|jgi:hypothetical protein|uniref:Uncharacterized protein n=1 Tax=Cyanidioschyzon merolae (strain NIES-3377 / 10D) TaxID=280699 RepID=M1V9B3_CYAM1|nr:hypothetical protein CYME_CMN267C [Cyanidioschyzon merolae strain 10D]BAM81349.1 hypothetical protein CYME_CMN267C [Cyanidioschyzon merolae strain 10D]|eukprot:XP_005537385.1 hypothetical protein CYME_CMN267C [Cyanidioschyzon merolae strain 10D]